MPIDLSARDDVVNAVVASLNSIPRSALTIGEARSAIEAALSRVYGTSRLERAVVDDQSWERA